MGDWVRCKLSNIKLHCKLWFNLKKYVTIQVTRSVQIPTRGNILSQSLLPVVQPSVEPLREDFREYVAHLQLHMTLQARNLLPSVLIASDSREALLYQTQADIEKWISRQGF